jgi:hypothetical protein
MPAGFSAAPLSARIWRALLVAALALLTLGVTGTDSARAYRGVPVGLYNVNNQVMNSPDYVYAIRFVVDQDTPLYRFISGFNLEGSDGLEGRSGYSSGDGGEVLARLVAVKPNGEPDMSQVLAQETVAAGQRYQESKAAYGAPGLTQLLYFNMGGIELTGGRTYAMTYQNVDSSPADNWFSENSPTVKDSVAGPNGVNTLDPNAPGAIAGLDPREAVAWSQDGGASWAWGRHVGEGDTHGAYGGSATDDDGARLPWYGWQSSPGADPQSNQPYYAYKESGSYTLRETADASTTLSVAGAYAPVGASAGAITVRNLSTGETATTAPLGSGLVKGALDHPVSVAASQAYEISNSGTVLKAEADSFIESTFKLGAGTWDCSTVGNGEDRAELYAAATGPSAATPTTAAAQSPTRIVVRKALLADPARPGAHKAPSKLLLLGRVNGASARPGMRVTVQLGVHGHWRRVGNTRLHGNGRFRLRRRGRLVAGRPAPLRARAIVRGIGHSRTVHVAVRR